MRATVPFVTALLLQGPVVLQLGTPIRPEYLRYERHVYLPAGQSGLACAALDATVLAHTASAAHSDLRLFHSTPDDPEAEVPYSLTESGPEPVADTAAAVEHPVANGNRLSFDLLMPARPYSQVRLRLGIRDFVATATVEGRDLHGGRKPLGSVAVFDLSAQGLGSWNSLLLEETSWPILHITLEVRTPSGAARTNLQPAMVQGAEVPPSRLRQTIYVPTVSTGTLEQSGRLSVAILRVPAHVPIERVLFRFAPGLAANFAREVTVSARADQTPITDTEALDAGVIEHISLPSGDPRLVPIMVREDALDATLGATLVRPANVLVAIDNHGLPPLPIEAVVLEMRERKLCFFADRVGTYTLRYGDPALPAPAYAEDALNLGATPMAAALGPETINERYVPRKDSRPFLKRHPELFWLVLLACSGMMGGSALHYVQHRRI